MICQATLLQSSNTQSHQDYCQTIQDRNCQCWHFKQKARINDNISIMIAFTEILSCNGTVVYQAINKQMNFFTSGKLEVLLAYDGMLLLRVNNFQYPVNGSQTIIYDQKDPQFALVLYLKRYPQDQWVVKINENADAVFSCMEEKTYMKNKNEKYEKTQTVTAKPQKIEEAKEVFHTSKDQEKEEKSVFIEASKHVNTGLKYAGGMLSKGFDNLGGFIANRVKKEEDTEVSDNTKENINKAKKATGTILGFASKQVGRLFKYGKQVASDLGQKFQNSQKGKEMMEHPRYEAVKNGAKTGAGVVANIYDGVVDAVYSIGSGVANGATKIVGAKYGRDAGEATDGALEGAGNVLKIARIPKDQLANTLRE